MDAGGRDEWLWACARGLDAVQEAERLGSWQVAVEHLLAASLLDPVARRLFLEATGEDGSARLRTARPVRAGVRSTDGSLPRTEQMTFSPDARAVLVRLVERCDDDASGAEVGWWRRPDVRSTWRRRLLHDLLTVDGPLLTDLVAPTDRRRLVGQLLDVP